MLKLCNVLSTNYDCNESELAAKFFTFAEEKDLCNGSSDINQDVINEFGKYLHCDEVSKEETIVLPPETVMKTLDCKPEALDKGK